MNYTELKAAIQAYTENTDTSFIAEIPVFVEQAEQRIYNSVQFPSLRKTVTLSTASGVQFVDCPTDFLSVYSMAVIDDTTSYQFLLNKDVSYIRQAYPKITDTGLPQYYALYGPTAASDLELRFIFGPTPGAVYSLDLQYFFYPESITTTATGRSWLGDNFDTVLLYGSLVEAYTYMKGEADMMQLYNQKYMEALSLAKRLGDGLERQDSYRSGQYKQPVG
jgi:hypothetical protein